MEAEADNNFEEETQDKETGREVTVEVLIKAEAETTGEAMRLQESAETFTTTAHANSVITASLGTRKTAVQAAAEREAEAAWVEVGHQPAISHHTLWSPKLLPDNQFLFMSTTSK